MVIKMVRPAILLLLLGCAMQLSCAVQTPPMPLPAPGEDEPVDQGCSYFYFLWGSHAELNQQYAEALEAYEKALICDPHAGYIKEKIPVLLLKMADFTAAAAWLKQAIAEEPDNLSYHLLLASLAIRQSSFEEAIRHYGMAIRIDPQNEEVQLHLGLLYTHTERYQEAEKLFRALLGRNGEDYQVHLALARLLKQTNRPQEATAAYERALTLNWSKELAYELGYYYVTLTLLKDALRVYTTITDNDHLDERASLNRIQTLLDLQQNDQALKELRILRTFSTTPTAVDIIISKVLLRQNQTATAKQLLEEVIQREYSSEAGYMLALLAFQDGDYPTALLHLSRIKAESKEFEDAVYLQVRIHEEQARTERAIALLNRHLATQAGQRPLFYNLLASLLQGQGDTFAAITVLEEAVTRYPHDPQLLFDYGMAMERNGMSGEAMVAMQKVLQLQPDHAEALNYIGYSWADSNIHLQQALEYIRRADELRPDNGFIVDSLGWVHYRLGNFDEAVRQLRRALTLVPDDPHIHDHLGDVYRSLHQRQEALLAYQQALDLFTEEEKRRVVQEKINALSRP